jgi:hypothetical protein
MTFQNVAKTSYCWLGVAMTDLMEEETSRRVPLSGLSRFCILPTADDDARPGSSSYQIVIFFLYRLDGWTDGLTLYGGNQYIRIEEIRFVF